MLYPLSYERVASIVSTESRVRGRRRRDLSTGVRVSSLDPPTSSI